MTHVVVYWHQATSTAGIPDDNSEETINYITNLNNQAGRLIPVYAQIPPILIRIWLDTNYGNYSAAQRNKAKLQIRSYIQKLRAAFRATTVAGVDGRFPLLAGWYVFDEPFIPVNAWFTPEMLKELLEFIATVQGGVNTGDGGSRPTMIAITPAFYFLESRTWDNWRSQGVNQWYLDVYPVDRQRAQFPHGPFSSDLASAHAYLEKFASDIKSVDANREVGYITQAFGFDPEIDRILNAYPHPFLNTRDQPVQGEVRCLTAIGMQFADLAIGYWAHYRNTASRLSQVFAPVTQELAQLTAEPTVPAPQPAWKVVDLNPLTTLPAITVTLIEVVRANFATAPLYAGPVTVPLGTQNLSGVLAPSTPNEVRFRDSSPLGLGLSLNPLMAGDRAIRVWLHKNSPVVGTKVTLDNGGTPKWEATQSYFDTDPFYPGWVVPWDGTVSATVPATDYMIEFDLTQLRAGQNQQAVSPPPTGGPINLSLTAVSLPSEHPPPTTQPPFPPEFTSQQLWSVESRVNYPQAPNDGHNMGVWARIFRLHPGPNTPVIIVLTNSSPLLWVAPFVSFPLTAINFTAAPTNAVIKLYKQQIGPPLTITGHVLGEYTISGPPPAAMAPGEVFWIEVS